MNKMLEKPEWLTKRVTNLKVIEDTAEMLEKLNLHTVCDGADCPNRCECYGNKTATFMILGSVCTRQCRFCAVTKGMPELLDPDEPKHVAIACRELGLKHVVVTSVTRDDLYDGGAKQFADTVREIKKENPEATVELLIPDLRGDWKALELILDAKPDILNHNVETVPEMYQMVRPQADYLRSLELLKTVKELNPDMLTKSGIMVGLGETEIQVERVMDDLRRIGCDILTIGQYLQPTDEHLELVEYIHPNQFDQYRTIGMGKGFRYVASGTFVRSSYNAAMCMEELK